MYLIRSNSCVESGLWHILTQRYNWEVTRQRGLCQGHAGCQQFHFIYGNPSLSSCSSSITPRAAVAYSSFEVSTGNVDRLREISCHTLYKESPSDETLSPFESLFLYAFMMWPRHTLAMIHRLRRTASAVQPGPDGLLYCIWQQWCTSLLSGLASLFFFKLLH